MVNYREEQPVHLQSYHESLRAEQKRPVNPSVQYRVNLINKFIIYSNYDKKIINWEETIRGREERAQRELMGLPYFIDTHHKIQIKKGGEQMPRVRGNALERANEESKKYDFRNQINGASKAGIAAARHRAGQ